MSLLKLRIATRKRLFIIMRAQVKRKYNLLTAIYHNAIKLFT
jgi:hypothetical protein